ncbi:MAG: amidohydrolase family protein [Verrucomicrobia bacterium]|nr:amidohydrolase family protein [Verrucomicrobiota bacterium]
MLDCTDLTVAAGFWNSHMHFFQRKWENAAEIPADQLTRQLEEMLTRHGFTSVFDTGSMWDNTRRLRDRIESGEVAGPRIRSTGEALVARGATPSEKALRAMGFMAFSALEVTDDAQAAAASQQLLAKGVDGIKVHLQPPPQPQPLFPESAILVAVQEAHRSGNPVFVHPDTGADILAAARSGVDIIAHTTPGSGPWDEGILTAMQEHGVALTPTLRIWSRFGRPGNPSQDQLIETAVGQLRAWVEREGTVLFGTDLGAIDEPPGAEYALMEQSGMSFRQILASLTTAPAERFRESSRLGRIAPGFRTDLVVLKGDPSRDLRSLASVRYTLRDGRIIYADTARQSLHSPKRRP